MARENVGSALMPPSSLAHRLFPRPLSGGLLPRPADLFLKRVGSAYHSFVEDTQRTCLDTCQQDLASTTRFVTWRRVVDKGGCTQWSS